jgi:glutaminyl-tRNA synthetase
MFVKRGLAYVDFSSQEEIKKQRGFASLSSAGEKIWTEPFASPYRDRDIENNIKDFQSMIDGKFEEKDCSLRLKMYPTSSNPNMRDLVAYTIKYTPHYKTNTLHCVYPSYDFSHCIVDVLEAIDFSYCTLEFESRQESYYWLIDEIKKQLLLDNNINISDTLLHNLTTKRPVVYEFSRLDVTGSLLSKRKIKTLVEEGTLSGYGDPRLMTIMGLKNRGYSPSSLLSVVSQLGHTRNISTISSKILEHSIRSELNTTAPRISGILDPLAVVIENIDADVELDREIGVSNPHKRKIYLRHKLFIDRSDFMLEPPNPKKYYRLTKDQKVRLKYADGTIEYIKHTEGINGVIDCVYVKFTKDSTTKTKACISWVSEKDSIPATFNLYNNLINDDGSFNHFSHNAKEGVIENLQLNCGDRFQIERVGYFIVHESRSCKVFLNQIVGLREDKDK